MRQVLGLLLASQAAALVVMPLVRPRVSFLSTSRTVMGAMEDAQEDDDGEKRLRKLKKDLKRIAELRSRDYLTLKTDQRVKLHSEPDVLLEMEAYLGSPAAVEALRAKLQPGFEPMVPSKNWTYERAKDRATTKARERTVLERSLNVVKGSGISVRPGDWRCACGAFCYASKSKCVECGAQR